MGTHSGSNDIPGKPCTKCGLRYSRETAYVDCLNDGETYEAWWARQNDAVRAIAHLYPPPGREPMSAETNA